MPVRDGKIKGLIEASALLGTARLVSSRPDDVPEQMIGASDIVQGKRVTIPPKACLQFLDIFEERFAQLLAHRRDIPPWVRDVADYVGDELELAAKDKEGLVVDIESANPTPSLHSRATQPTVTKLLSRFSLGQGKTFEKRVHGRVID